MTSPITEQEYFDITMKKTPVTKPVKEHIVKKGESLWNIAQEELGNVKKTEIQDYIYKIAKLNNKNSIEEMNSLKINEKIYLPEANSNSQNKKIQEKVSQENEEKTKKDTSIDIISKTTEKTENKETKVDEVKPTYSMQIGFNWRKSEGFKFPFINISKSDKQQAETVKHQPKTESSENFATFDWNKTERFKPKELSQKDSITIPFANADSKTYKKKSAQKVVSSTQKSVQTETIASVKKEPKVIKKVSDKPKAPIKTKNNAEQGFEIVKNKILKSDKNLVEVGITSDYRDLNKSPKNNLKNIFEVKFKISDKSNIRTDIATFQMDKYGKLVSLWFNGKENEEVDNLDYEMNSKGQIIKWDKFKINHTVVGHVDEKSFKTIERFFQEKVKSSVPGAILTK